MTTPIAPLTAARLREIEQGLLADTAGRTNLCYAERDALTLPADARAMRELVRRALSTTVEEHSGRGLAQTCSICDWYVPHERARWVGWENLLCKCAPGVSFEKDAINAKLHEEVP